MPSKGIIIGYLIFVILAIILYLNWQAVAPVSKEFNPQPFVVEKGEGVQEIAQKLKEGGLIKNEKFFQIFVFLKNVRNKFWPGKYYISQDMNLLDIIKSLTNKPLAEEETITIIEGWTIREIADYLEQKSIIEKDIFLTEANNLRAKMQGEFDILQDLPAEATLEGFLFPDTYRIYDQATTESIIRRMFDNFDSKMTPEMRVGINNQNKTIFEVMIMASLLEKEGADEIDKRLIADLFWRRLEAGIPLQSCATINYILGTSKPQLSFEETRTPSPYNTYINRGLPQGPINNPGLESIKAAISPLKNDYWYFLAPAEGETIFSRTKEEHDKNKAQYLK